MRRWTRSQGCCQARSVATASLPDPGSDEPECDAGGNDRDREADQRKSESRDVCHAGKVGRQARSVKAPSSPFVILSGYEAPLLRSPLKLVAPRDPHGASAIPLHRVSLERAMNVGIAAGAVDPRL